jgi:hypothetical protein
MIGGIDDEVKSFIVNIWFNVELVNLLLLIYTPGQW